MLASPGNTTHGWFEPFFWNSALMTGLAPSTVYFYIFGSDAHGWSNERSFVSAPVTGPHQALNIIACADVRATGG